MIRNDIHKGDHTVASAIITSIGRRPGLSGTVRTKGLNQRF